MPYFRTEVEIDIDEFYNKCTQLEKISLSKQMVLDNIIAPDQTNMVKNRDSKLIESLVFYEALNKLSGKEHLLSDEDVNTIIKISQKI